MTTETPSEIEARKLEPSIWYRGLFMLLFVPIYAVAEAVVLVVALFQFGSILIMDERNARLERFAESLSEFIYQTIRFWTFASDEKPFPFADWPEGRSDTDPR